MITADHARIPASIALQLCAESPEALAVLCRVLWFARGSGECFASKVSGAFDKQTLSLFTKDLKPWAK